MQVTLRTTATSLWVSGTAGTVHVLCGRVQRTRPLSGGGPKADGSLAATLRAGQDTPWHKAATRGRTCRLPLGN